MAPHLDNWVGVVMQAGPDQSIIRFLTNRDDEFLPQEMCLPNHYFRPYRNRVRLKLERVRLKPERVRLKQKRVRL